MKSGRNTLIRIAATNRPVERIQSTYQGISFSMQENHIQVVHNIRPEAVYTGGLLAEATVHTPNYKIIAFVRLPLD